MQVLSAHGEISPVDAVLHLVSLRCPLVVVAHLAFELEEASFFVGSVFLGFQHVVTL